MLDLGEASFVFSIGVHRRGLLGSLQKSYNKLLKRLKMQDCCSSRAVSVITGDK